MNRFSGKGTRRVRGASALVLAASAAAWATVVTPLPVGAATTGDGDLGSGISGYGRYLAGRMAEHLNDPRAAANHLALALTTEPRNIGLLKRAFAVMLRTGRMVDAIDLAERVLVVDPEAPFETLLIAMRDVRSGALEAAEKRLTAMPRTGINRVLTPLATAWVQAAQSRYDDALGTLDGLGTAKGFNLLRHLHRAFVLDLAGRADAALESYESAKAATAEPSFRVLEAVSNFHARAGRLAEAEAQFQTFAERSPDSVRLELALDALRAPGGLKPLVGNAFAGLAEAYYDLASALYQENSQRRAVMFARLALYMRADFDIATMLLGDIQESRGQFAEAAATYRSIGAATPHSWLSRLRLAHALKDSEQLDEALSLLDALADERPDRSDPLVAKGDFLRTSERFAEAVVAYDQAIARTPQLERRQWSLLYTRGIALERSDQWERAEKDFLKALELEPDQPYVLNYLGYSWVEKGIHLDRARGMIERAVELRPNDGYIADSLGWALYGTGEYEDAVIHLERAVELKPADPVINDHLGDAFWMVGREAEARFQWRRALRLDPDPDIIGKIESKIEQGIKSVKPGETDT